jgi:hypothetical protein
MAWAQISQSMPSVFIFAVAAARAHDDEPVVEPEHRADEREHELLVASRNGKPRRDFDGRCDDGAQT